ncbi:MAG TPA: FAD-binding oxidoreductase [Gaiellaceae bacterium]
MDRRGFLGLAAASALRPAADGPVQALAHELDGHVVAQGASGYAAALRLWDTRFDDLRPRAIAYCANAADVQRTVRWGRANGVRIVPRSGGHSYGGYSSGDGVVVADVSLLHGVSVGAGNAAVGAGATLIAVYAELASHGVTIPGGSCPTVGIAGLALGGGYGYASRLYGLTADNVKSMRIVTADGSLLTCDPSTHPDLFWACRGGGGGNFGIATSFTFATHPAPTVSTYEIQWPWKQAVSAVAAWQEFAPHAPDALTSGLDLIADTTGPHVVAAGQYVGAKSALRKLIAPLASTGTPTIVKTTTLTYLEAMLHWAGCRDASSCTSGRTTFDARSDYVDAPLSRAAISLLTEAIGKHEGSTAAIYLDAYGGAINRVAKSATAFVHRDALFSIQYTAKASFGWLDALYAAMRPHVSGYAYQNYIDPKLASWQHAYYGANLARLQAVKRTYDPHDAFRFAQSIPS